MKFGFGGFKLGLGGGRTLVQWLLDAMGLGTTTTYTGPTAHWVAGNTGTLINQGGLVNSAGQAIPPIRGATISGGAVTAAGDAMVFEAEATNYQLQSNTFSSWNKRPGVAVTLATANAAADPFGGTAMWKLEDGSSSDYAELVLTNNSVASNASRVATCYVKKDTDETRFPEFFLYDQVADGYVFFLNTKTGATYSRAAAGNPAYTDVSVVESPTGFWKVTVKVTFSAARTSSAFYIRPAASNNFSTFDNAPTGFIYVGFVQVETGLYPSSYIPTTTAAVTRPATRLLIPTPAAFNDASGFQTRLKLTPKALPGTDQIIVADATSGARLYVKGADNKVYWKVGAKEIATAALTVGTTYNLGIRQTTSGASIALNSTVTTDATMTTIPALGATLEIGSVSNTLYGTFEIAADTADRLIQAFGDSSAPAGWYAEVIP